ncbi:hypothetical protein F2P81_026369 [Scophthalmus maximus]|uniref:Secreted protein n=1 Tax=Scophthalmus maximus TaxID=52904 RepID=A0A6A4RML1_SCOMX|nr:hypothetical protein F2P81_026369 [Scophthalmus maximus]
MLSSVLLFFFFASAAAACTEPLNRPVSPGAAAHSDTWRRDGRTRQTDTPVMTMENHTYSAEKEPVT